MLSLIFLFLMYLTNSKREIFQLGIDSKKTSRSIYIGKVD